MSKFDSIRHYHDHEVNEVLQQISKHPMIKALMGYTFPNKTEEQWMAALKEVKSIQQFQDDFAYYSIQRILEKSSNGLTTSGFDKLEKDTAYLYISNHRDILMDTSLLNVALKDNGLVMTASAIGDNLVQKSFLLALAKVNRNFLVKRGLPPRELLESSKLMSEYIQHLLFEENRSVWIAQREGRTKDGNDATHQGVLKMIGMASDEADLMDYFKKVKIVPVSISYEYDPTDAMKMPQLLAKANDEVYVKDKNEDFINLYSGIIGQKRGIHIHVGEPLANELDTIKETVDKTNKQMQAVATEIDKIIVKNYFLWPTNYIAYDIMHGTNTFADKYTEKERQLFERRLELRVDKENKIVVDGFLAMYANPVINQLKLKNEQ
ncbi:1-acyl-sn-glycerol-3-phosphate acyltransferase [Myroides marinus]|uniref:1-acyl-sn-glycerol-3-phosphate acyltransferase n=1 Tax=Myroides marinus TaxID=703342 RepID=UPI0025766F6B|nr:1-acyl-sn-glycerol-3-phosphate acyltransferase [Myroides marinus]MDM1347096.1 1-acyl-sn-glycerol-3-phosphate acyltransferase [Myroides marinus]MDM1350615.1 1-acyl-sn-glycerol-3-phosphate acyltransferase [Myroides marinus]MDM1354335.1 1-acyl-sn-glycerol-3-phosphate acyltransferase [Myroides marinus]MDM1357822.1 1-acyl-sn-glycerol-3-phosphate acyltransferase [Myroides marinus]MDM1365244.1 1-acyl-sn-glycerol-3-phosphate acyltransferase [Myroides marinus]